MLSEHGNPFADNERVTRRQRIGTVVRRVVAVIAGTVLAAGDVVVLYLLVLALVMQPTAS